MNRPAPRDKRNPRAIRLALSAGLSLGAIIGLVGCAEEADQVEGDQAAALQSENGFNFNGFAFNGFNFNGMSFNGFNYNGFNFNGMSFNGMSYNGMSYNGMSYNGMSFNGLATSGGLATTSGLMTTEGGRQFVDYMVKIGYPAGHSLTKQDQFGNSYTFQGALGVAPEIESGSCNLDCQEKMSGALLAHVNNSGLHVGIWLVGPDNGIGWGTSPDFPYQEGTYFGNLFAQNIPGNYCTGKNMGAGDAKGRLGSPFGNNASIMNAPYGWQYDNASQQNVPSYCVNTQIPSNGCTAQNEGFSSCNDPAPAAPYAAGHRWTHPVTVYRNFEPTMLFKICNKVGGNAKCLGVVGGSTASGANVEIRSYAGAAGQTWQVLKGSTAGSYKIINKSSGMSLDVNGTQVVQKPYTSQSFPVSYVSTDPGYSPLKLSGSSAALWTNWQSNDGALVTTITGQDTADTAKWMFMAVGPASIDPGKSYKLAPKSAPTKAIDIANGSQSNGTAVQQYDGYGGDPQKLVLKDSGKGNVKLTMKANNNKCVGPKGGAPAHGVKLEVQDCNGSNAQAWITGETAAGSGVFMLKNVAAPGLCVDVTGASSANGAAMQVANCTGQGNQLFGATLSP
jgi:hypothetical protein